MKHKKKILHLTYDMRIGGTEMVIKSLIEGTDKTLFDVEILCIESKTGPFGDQLIEQGCTITNLNWLGGFDKKLIKQIRHYLKKNSIDVLHCHQYTPWVYATLAALGMGSKVIFTEHGRFYPDYSSWKRRFINPLLALFTYKITAISKATKQALVDYEFLSAGKIDVIYNGIKGLQADKDDVTRTKNKLNISADTLVFGTIARLDPIKNHDMMIRAFAKTLEKLPSAMLIIVGDGDLMGELKGLVNDLNIKESVIFTGYIPYPKDYLAIFDIFLLSSLSEGTSMTLLEAMSLEKPCVVTDAGGNKEIIAHGETGLVTDNNNMQQYSDAMILLGTDPEQISIYGKQAKIRFQEQFDTQHMSNAYEQCYGE